MGFCDNFTQHMLCTFGSYVYNRKNTAVRMSIAIHSSTHSFIHTIIWIRENNILFRFLDGRHRCEISAFAIKFGDSLSLWHVHWLRELDPSTSSLVCDNRTGSCWRNTDEPIIILWAFLCNFATEQELLRCEPETIEIHILFMIQSCWWYYKFSVLCWINMIWWVHCLRGISMEQFCNQELEFILWQWTLWTRAGLDFVKCSGIQLQSNRSSIFILGSRFN